MDKNSKWSKQSVVYQIYPRSFYDSNGDGIGDIPGITNRLDYLSELGVDALWLSPVCRSPQDDNGYDISVDLVLNHSSDEHPWFLEAKKSKTNPYHDYYVWRDGEEGILPNDMKATFGGSAWTWVPELSQYYFHQFSVKQPDLNWENPKLRREIYDMILWWMDKGIGGFRLDVIDQIAKEPMKGITANGPRLHEFIRELSKETFQKGNLITVGEAWGVDIERAKLKENLCQWQKGLYGCGWNSLFFGNHDLPRIVSRWGDDGKFREKSAKMLATVLHGMQGTPYIYQGGELGMTNAHFKDITKYRDIETLNVYKERKAAGYGEKDLMNSIMEKSRDNSRTPMQWDDSVNAGFSSGTPWIQVNPNYREINVRQQQGDPDSVFHYYQRLIALRKQYPVFTEGRFDLYLPEEQQIFSYIRNDGCHRLLVYANFTRQETLFSLPKEWESAKLLLGHYKVSFLPEQKEQSIQAPGGHSLYRLRPYEAGILYI